MHPEVGFRTISTYWVFNPSALPQPSGSTPSYGYIFNIKYAPYSAAVSTLDMSTQTGPSAYLDPIGDQGKTCNLTLGAMFGQTGQSGTLVDSCIEVFQNQATDTLGLEKVLGNLTHDDQNFSFSIVGVSQNYRPPELDIGHTPGAPGGAREFDVIHDGEQPGPTATAVDFTLDVRAFGAIQNDMYPTTMAGVWNRDDHGAGAVYREYGRMVQEDLADRYAKQNGTTPRALHDPACLFPSGDHWGPPPPLDGGTADAGTTDAGTTEAGATEAGTVDAGYFSGPQQWHAAPGCTGFEAWIDEAYPNVWAYTNPSGSQVAGMPVSTTDATQTDPANVFDVGFNFGSFSNGGLRPGTPYALFCMDPGVYSFCGAPSLYGLSADLLDASFQQVLQIMGDGDIDNLPPGAGDRRYFFMMYNRALAKFFFSGAALHTGACGGPATSQPGYCANSTNAGMNPVPYFGDYLLNTDDMFFDSFGPNGNRSEFINFDFADLTHDPMGFNLSVLLIGSNWREEHFYERLDREERALFMAMQNEDSKAAGQAAWALTRDSSGNPVMDEWGWPRKNADMFLTNLAGSPAIAAGPWVGVPNPNPTDGGPVYKPITQPATDAGPAVTNQFVDPCFPATPLDQVGKSPWYCATHLDPDCPVQAPTNSDGTLVTRDNGEPILAGYCGVWNPTAFALGSSNIQVISGQPGSHITAQQGQLEREAEVLVPSYANPYDLTTKMTPIDVLVPWGPNDGSNGFAVPSNAGGQTSVFVRTAFLEFSGQIIVPVIDYWPTPAADGGPSNTISIQAYESSDFLGDLFLCYDTVTAASRAGTRAPGDILTVHMYTPVQHIVSWIANHPEAQTNCSIVLRYGPSNNYPDCITSVVNGVTVDIDPGQGSGRVVDATLFVPGSGLTPAH